MYGQQRYELVSDCDLQNQWFVGSVFGTFFNVGSPSYPLIMLSSLCMFNLEI